MRGLFVFLFFVLATIGLIFFKSYVLAITFPVRPTPPKAPERIIIKFGESTSSFSRENLLKTHKISIKEKIKLPNTFVLSVPAEKKGDLIKIFSQNKLIDYIEPDFIAQKVEGFLSICFLNRDSKVCIREGIKVLYCLSRL